jgi:hypothetical protein
MAMPFLAEHGAIIAMKGKISDSEIDAAKKLAMPLNIERYTLPFIDADRAILELRP